MKSGGRCIEAQVVAFESISICHLKQNETNLDANVPHWRQRQIRKEFALTFARNVTRVHS